MSIITSLVQEFEHEMGNTRRVLERLPDGKFDWKPHEKSYSMGKLAAHVANMPIWIGPLFTTSELDFASGDPVLRIPNPKTRAEVLEEFEKTTAAAREGFAKGDDATLSQPWTLRMGEHVIFTIPRIAAYRSFFMHHQVHHRAQLTVYLRLNDVPVPGLYGPSADEQ